MKAGIRYPIFAILVLLMPEHLICQTILLPQYNPPDIRWDNILLKGGEASQSSLCILLDRNGFLWSGTESGLYRYDGTRFVEYGVSRAGNNGFAGYSVNTIFEDSGGTIWIGTSDALNKLDQNTGTFLHYFPDSTRKSDISNFIKGIHEDRDGLLWIRTKRDIYSFDRGKGIFTEYQTDSLSWYPPNDIFNLEAQSFAEDRYGNKWFVTFRGLYEYKSQDHSFRMVLPDPDNGELGGISRIRSVCTDQNGTIWIGTEGEGLLKWNHARNRAEKIAVASAVIDEARFQAVTSILADSKGTIWSFGNGTFSNYDPVNNNLKTYRFIHPVKTLYEYSTNDIFIDQVFENGDGTISFLNKYAGLMFWFDPVSEKLSLYRVPKYSVFQCIMDNSGSYWFACVRNNIFRLVQDQLPYLTVSVNNSSHIAQIHRGTFLEDNQNHLYFLFLPGTYVCMDFDVSSSLVFQKFRFPSGDSIAGGGYKDNQGNFWFGDISGHIAKYDPLTGSLTMVTHKIAQEYTEVVYVPLIRQDRSGNIWVASSRGLYMIDPLNGQLKLILDFSQQSRDRELGSLQDFLIDSQGYFWILSSEDLLSIRMPELKIHEFTGYGDNIFSSGLYNIRVEENSRGEVYLLNTRYGVYRFVRQNESFVKVDITDEEAILEYYDLLIDRKDRLWVTHNRGISIADPGHGSSRLIKITRLQFDIQSFQVSSGEILYLNENQLYVFQEDIPVNTSVPPVYLTRLLVNGTDYHQIFSDSTPVSSLHKITLPFRLNTLNFEFAALNYLDPERNQYRYFMEGFDRDTALIGQGLPAEYKNIPPGNYKFWVTGSNNDGLWNPSGVTLDIRINPPWYRSSAAYLSYVILMAFIISLYMRRRESQLRNEKRMLEAEIKAATAELEHKNAQLQDMDRIKTHFFTNIAHEIRTPLTLILGPVESISNELLPGHRMTGMFEMMKRNAHRLTNLVNQLLDISRLDAGKMKISLTEDDIVKCIRILVYEFLSLAEGKRIKYIAELPEKAFITLFDRDKIEKILTNLLSNAFKYTPPDGTVHCTVRIEPCESTATPFLYIKVIDTGPGIVEEHQARIFDRFYRVEGHHESAVDGTGIGLSLVHEFVSLLHGKIKVESSPGRGSDFLVKVPVGKNHLSPEEYVIIPSEPSKTGNADFMARRDEPVREASKPVQEGKMRLLVIEDNEDLRAFIKDALEDEYVILESDNGKAGLNMAFTMMPDLIMTDIMMPDLDGMELCSILKNDERTSHIPIIMLTARATSEDRIAGLKKGADDYIVKPFNLLELRTRISNLLEMRSKLKSKYGKLHLFVKGTTQHESVDDRFMMRVLQTINARIPDFSFDVGTLSEQLGMSRTHLTRKLKILTGLSPGTIIRNTRLEKAAELCADKAGNITEIACSVGYSNPSHFTKAFSHYFGISPRKYVKLHPRR